MTKVKSPKRSKFLIVLLIIFSMNFILGLINLPSTLSFYSTFSFYWLWITMSILINGLSLIGIFLWERLAVYSLFTLLAINTLINIITADRFNHYPYHPGSEIVLFPMTIILIATETLLWYFVIKPQWKLFK